MIDLSTVFILFTMASRTLVLSYTAVPLSERRKKKTLYSLWFIYYSGQRVGGEKSKDEEKKREKRVRVFTKVLYL